METAKEIAQLVLGLALGVAILSFVYIGFNASINILQGDPVCMNLTC